MVNPAHSVSRLTLFSVLSSIEADLRAAITSYLLAIEDLPALLGPELYEGCLRRFSRESGFRPAAPDLADLLPFIDFADSYLLLNRNGTALPENVSGYITSITPRLERLVAVRNRVMHGRPLDHEDFPSVIDTANDFIRSGDHLAFWESLAPCMHRLESHPEMVLNVELEIIEESSGVAQNLPTPDFDETGFLGRKEDVKAIKELCLGPFPVVTIMGDGGIGKSALALKVAYDLLDDASCPFEAIVWTSCKTAQLTANGMREIEDSITSSLGMLKAAASELSGAVEIEDPADEVLQYLREFKVLLIIDNLETVLDQTVRSFLSRLPNGAKILITSRIGVGAFEYPYRLKPLDESEAVVLLRAIAKRRRVGDLVAVPNDRMKVYCRRMRFNPLYLKWFVSCVQAGRPPEQILSQPEDFLDFAMSNVYEHLEEDSRAILQAMLVIPGAHSQAELVYLTELEVEKVQIALQQLLSSNMLEMKSKSNGSSYNTTYEIPDLAQKYLVLRKPVNVSIHEAISRRWRQLIVAKDQASAERSWSPYSFKAISTRSTTDLVVAKYLRDALDHTLAFRLEEAEQSIEDAKRMAPDFFEVHRVEALYHVYRKNLAAARSCYEAAIELEPKSAPLRTWYAGFLMREAHDTPKALRELLEALRLAPDAIDVKRELGTVYLFLAEFDKSIGIISEILERGGLDAHAERKVRGLLLNVYKRWAAQCNGRRDSEGAYSALSGFLAAWNACRPELRDDRMEVSLQQAISESTHCCNTVNEAAREKHRSLYQSLRSLQSNARRPLDDAPDGGTTYVGTISRVQSNFGFLKCVEFSDDLYFNVGYLVDMGEWKDCIPGAEVSFEPGQNVQGPCAKRIRVNW